ncbi:choice-of-anchor P family protein [Prauserella oleivorans]
MDGTPTHVGPIAPCSVAGPAAGSTSGVRVGDDTEYGRGQTRCARAEDGTSTATASGQRFETSVLEEYGGPVIRVRTYSAECHTTRNGSSGHVELGGVSGFPLPADIPPNHVVTIPGAHQGDPPMARLVLNEFTAPEPPDGSLTTSALRITLFPEGGPVSGDIRVGSATCDPYGG